MTARFHGGPLDGVEIELSRTIDKVLILDDDGSAIRYECDAVELLPEYAAGNLTPDCLMSLSPLPDEFDEEVCELLGRSRSGSE